MCTIFPEADILQLFYSKKIKEESAWEKTCSLTIDHIFLKCAVMPPKAVWSSFTVRKERRQSAIWQLWHSLMLSVWLHFWNAERQFYSLGVHILKKIQIPKLFQLWIIICHNLQVFLLVLLVPFDHFCFIRQIISFLN